MADSRPPNERELYLLKDKLEVLAMKERDSKIYHAYWAAASAIGNLKCSLEDREMQSSGDPHQLPLFPET